MIDHVNDYLARTYVFNRVGGYRYQQIRPRLRCADGLEFSIQASAGHYCAPRRDGENAYLEVEIGYPSEAVPEWLEYAENPEEPTGTVYGWVPVTKVNRIIDAHGGLATDKHE